MDFLEVRCGPVFPLLIFLFAVFFLLLERCVLSEYRLLLTEFERRLGFRLARAVICFLAVFLGRSAGRDLDVRGLVDILFLLEV